MELVMPDCERLEKCPFFSGHMPDMPAVAELIKLMFCRGDKTQCARYRVAVAGLQVPADLYPQDQDRANNVIRGR
jgi:hypothetical protein